MKNYKILLLAALMTGVGSFISCSSDDDDNNTDTSRPESQAITTFDDLSYFQNAIVQIDSLGHFLGRSIGEPLYKNDTTQLFVGVDNMAQAEEYFRSWVAPQASLSQPATGTIVYNLTSEDGKAQGTITFQPGTEEGHVAEVTASAGTQLKHFKRITFMLNKAWPVNSERGRYRRGDIRKIHVTAKGWVLEFSGDVSFVCVREKGNGVKPLYVALTKEAYQPSNNALKLIESGYCPGKSNAKLISQELRKDWDMFVDVFDEAGGGKLSDSEKYWIDARSWIVGQQAINLKSGALEAFDTWFHNHSKHILLKVDWEND